MTDAVRKTNVNKDRLQTNRKTLNRKLEEKRRDREQTIRKTMDAIKQKEKQKTRCRKTKCEKWQNTWTYRRTDNRWKGDKQKRGNPI